MEGFNEGSRLDKVTVGLYSVLKTLKAKGKGNNLEFGIIDFSDATQFSGYCKLDDLEKFEEVALTDQHGGSNVKTSVLVSALKGGKKTLVLFLSDGEIVFDKDRTSYKEVAKYLKAHSVPHVVAPCYRTCFTEAAAEEGVPAYVIEDLSQVGSVFSAIIGGAGQ
jgi:hypothetical protein